jgi:hypothetical protein
MNKEIFSDKYFKLIIELKRSERVEQLIKTKAKKNIFLIFMSIPVFYVLFFIYFILFKDFGHTVNQIFTILSTLPIILAFFRFFKTEIILRKRMKLKKIMPSKVVKKEIDSLLKNHMEDIFIGVESKRERNTIEKIRTKHLQDFFIDYQIEKNDNMSLEEIVDSIQYNENDVVLSMENK